MGFVAYRYRAFTHLLKIALILRVFQHFRIGREKPRNNVLMHVRKSVLNMYGYIFMNRSNHAISRNSLSGHPVVPMKTFQKGANSTYKKRLLRWDLFPWAWMPNMTSSSFMIMVYLIYPNAV